MNEPPKKDNFELSVDIYIDAPPQQVWQIMTERLTEWWCPKPWTTEVIEMDWRAGGRCAMTMHGPNGEKYPSDGIFLEVTPGRRFVTTDALDCHWNPCNPFMIGFWEIAAEGKGTRYTGRALHWTQEAYEQHKAMGFEPGWGAVAKQLKELAEE